MKIKLLAVSLAASLIVIAGAATAATYRVSQESSAGAGDFDANILGTVSAFNTGLTGANFYQYGNTANASYNGQLNGGPNPLSSVTQVFLVNASDGLSLAVVHDNPSDGSGGTTATRWNLTGDTAAQVVADDPGEPVTVSGGGTQFDSRKNWLACCTDGYMLGDLNGMWTMFGQFLTNPNGITSWQVTDGAGGSIGLTLAAGQRVRIDKVNVIPVPASLPLLAFGIGGLGYMARRKRKAA